MQRFIDDNSTYSFPFPEEFKEDFSSLCMTETRLTGSVADTLEGLRDTSTCTLPARSKYSTLGEQDMEYLHSLLFKLYPSTTHANIPNAVFHKYTFISRNGKTIGYLSSRQKASSSPCIAMAEWDVNLYGPPPTALTDPSHPSSKFRPVKIQHFAKVSLSVEDHVQQFVFARVAWYQPHPYQYKLGKPAEVWCHDLFEHHGLHSFISLEKIVSRCVYCTKSINNDPVLIIVAIIE